MPPRIHHFIVRPEIVKRLPTGLVVEQPLVPLIPLDELPEWLEIVGIPRQLTPEQATGISNLGCFERQGMHDVEIIIDEPESDSGADDVEDASTPTVHIGKPPAVVGGATAKSGLDNSRWADAMNDNGLPGKTEATAAPSSAAPQAAMHPTDRMMAHVSSSSAAISGIVGQENRSSIGPTPTNARQPSRAGSDASSTASPDQAKHPKLPTDMSSKKRHYCRHWVHHGTCKWGPYCRFTHTMPATLSGLSEVGLREFPSWWTAAMGLALSSPGAFGPRKMPYRDMGMGLNGMGYGFDMPSFMQGYGPGGGLGGPGGYIAGHGWKDGEVHPHVRPFMHERERVRKARVEAGGGGVMPGMKNLDGAEKQSVKSVGLPVARGAVAAQGTVAVGGEATRREGLEQQMRQEVQQQQVVAQQKLVDV